MVQWPWPPGTIVVCVDARPPRHAYDFELSAPLEQGAYYTIKQCYVRNTIHAVWLNEITINRLAGDGNPKGFLATRFRPAESDHCETTTIKETVHA